MLDRVTEYAQHVVANGQYPDTGRLCGELHILACKRHLDDIERQRTADFPYYWDAEASEHILKYAGMLTLSEGFKPTPLTLMGCQQFDVGCTFGWKKTSNDRRRFRRRYKSISRQQGKTMENGLIGTYIAGFSGYRQGKLFTAATKKRQSRLAWEEMAKFITADPDLAELFDIKDYKSLIQAKQTECSIEALSREGGLDDGFRAIYISLDELHQQKDNSIYKALYNGTRSLPETLVSMISTRGKDLNSFCFEMDKYAQDVLRGASVAEDFFIDIYTMDKDDDIWDEKNWSKSCPFTCADDERLNTLRTDAQTAKDMGGMELTDFLVKSLNMWAYNTDNQYVDVDKFLACGTDRKLDYFTGRECYAGLDLSSGGDLTTLALEIPFVEDGRQKYYLWSHSFMPRARLQEHIKSDLAPYDCWQSEKLITVTGGMGDYKNDYMFIVKTLEELIEKYDLKLKAIGYDSHNADGFLSSLDIFGCPLVEIKQSARFLNDATSDLQLLVKQGDIEYDKANGLFIWSFVNAQVVSNSFGEIKVDKENGNARSCKRIDPVDAAIDAHVIGMKQIETTVDVDSSINKFLEWMK